MKLVPLGGISSSISLRRHGKKRKAWRLGPDRSQPCKAPQTEASRNLRLASDRYEEFTRGQEVSKRLTAPRSTGRQPEGKRRSSES